MSKIRVEVSVRHCHLCQKDIEKLFGKGYKLNNIKKISQPKQFAAKETVIIKTKTGELEEVRVVGPARKRTQAEIAVTDAINLNLKPPIRLSGKTKNSASAILIGPKGQIKLRHGIIIMQRHIHCNPKEAQKLGLKNNQTVSAKISGKRGVIYNNIVVRVDKKFKLSLHLDTDEANASMPFLLRSKAELLK